MPYRRVLASLIVLLALAASVAGVRRLAGATAGDVPRLQFGVYDPHQAFAGVDWLAVEHVFVAWQADNGALLTQAGEFAARRRRMLLVSVEPWPKGDRSPRLLLRDTLAGAYDEEIDRFCSQLAGLAQPVFVRWGHEMEDPTGRYPWAQPEAADFVAAYRHFVGRCRASVKDAYFVWSPKGKSALRAYYPGGDYVDYVGLSLYGLPAWDRDHVGRFVSFDERFGESYRLVSPFGKPVMIAELGVGGDADYRRLWLSQLRNATSQFPLLRLAILFVAQDPEPWPGPYGAPDWRISAEELLNARITEGNRR